MSNAVPMLVLVVALTIELMLSFVPLDIDRKAKDQLEKLTTPHPHELEPIYPNWSVEFGIAVTLMLIGTWLMFPEIRKWCQRLATRPLPALRIMDVFATHKLMESGAFLLFVLAYVFHLFKLTGQSITSRMAGGMITQSGAEVLAVMAAIWLARRRAGGPHGSLGIWPFWTLIRGQRPIWKDMLLGVACYPLMFVTGLLVILPLENRFIEWAGWQPRTHAIIAAFSESMPAWVIFVFCASAVLCAPLYEELFFRGALYNMLRRYTGGAVSCILAGIVFAVMHPFGSWLTIFFLALILTWLYERTGRLIASMTLHAVFNGVSMALTLHNYTHAHGGN